jgi:GT2 family glycosyltransferase
MSNRKIDVPTTRPAPGVRQTDTPALSVLVISWNTRELTLACLASLYANPPSAPFETILLDNGSADHTADAVAARFPQVRLIREETNHGFAAGNNLAAASADGRFLLLLNSDTEVLEGALDSLLRFAGEHPEAGIWGGRTVFADGSLNPMSAWGRLTMWSTMCFALGLTRAFPRTRLFNPEALGDWDRMSEREVDIVSGCYFLIRRDLWTRLGGFETTFFMYGEEADLCRRARKLGARPRVTPDSTIVHHGGGSLNSVRMISYVTGAKIELARRSMNPSNAEVVRLLLIAAAWLRRTAFGFAALVSKRAIAPAATWRQVWALRDMWRNGAIGPSAFEGGRDTERSGMWGSRDRQTQGPSRRSVP